MISSTSRKVGLVQGVCGPDPLENFERTLMAIRRAAKQGAQIICTQELFRSTYFCQREDASHFGLAESIPGPSTDRLQSEALALGVVIVASLFEERTPGLYHNSAVVIDADGALLGKYRKMHIPDDPGYYEKYYFTPGDLGFPVWRTKFGCVGVLICWDQWFPEAARLMALQGAEILFYPTAIGWLPGERDGDGKTHIDAWRTVQRAHAVTNGCYVAAVNRVGWEKGEGEDGIEFWGGSFLASPGGEVVAEAPVDEESVIVAEADWEAVRRTRIMWPFLRDRRVDAYSGIERRFID